MIRNRILYVLIPVIAAITSCTSPGKEFTDNELLFNDGWEFLIADDSLAGFRDPMEWQQVSLPHTPVIEPLVVNDQWQGTCWYRKRFFLGDEFKGKNLFLRFEGAMMVADVWVNGIRKVRHLGGFLPFSVDFTADALPGDTNEIIVKLDNRDNPVTGPKPLDILDFNMYGGLYRDVFLVAKNDLFITDAVFENIEAGGGIFIRYPEVARDLAVIEVKTHVRNAAGIPKDFHLVHQVFNGDTLVLAQESDQKSLHARSAEHYTAMLELENPALWSPKDPHLYSLVTQVLAGGSIMDSDTVRIGIKRIEFEGTQLLLNGEKTFLRGVNRHQEYPYVGYALSNAAQYRDAVKIKEAGFDYVRLSHYPHSPAFMDACDEVGLLVVDAILGWQYYSDEPDFRKHVFQTCRDLVRRDRNHACVLAWEVSLNESWMPEEFIDSMTSIAHREYPGDQCFTAGWQEYGYDIYLQARQHRLQHYSPPDKPYIVSEYGDWEYYAMNAGLNQDSWQGLRQEERSSRQLLSGGEERLLQQATNIQEAHNDNFNTPAFADGYWVMFDYNRGYADDLEASGIMSINRVPKFSYYFFRSQRDPSESSSLYSSGPMVYIASCWNEDSNPEVRVFSNCEEAALYLDDSLLSRQKPDTGRISSNLAHPPFTFNTGGYKKGILKAVGYINDREAASFERATPGSPEAILLSVDESGQPPKTGVNDVLFIHATLIDSIGTTVPVNGLPVTFRINGEGEIVGPDMILTEAGIATALVRVGQNRGTIGIKASALGIDIGETSLSPR